MEDTNYYLQKQPKIGKIIILAGILGMLIFFLLGLIFRDLILGSIGLSFLPFFLLGYFCFTEPSIEKMKEEIEDCEARIQQYKAEIKRREESEHGKN